MSDKEHRGATRLPEAQNFVLHAHSSEGVERAEGFVEEQNLGMIDEGASQSDALSHATGKMVRVGVSERFEADKAHEFIDFVPFLLQQTTGNKAGLNVLSDAEPGEKVWVLEYEAAFCAWLVDAFVADPELAGVGKVQAGSEPKESGFSTAAGTDNGNEFAGGEGERDILEGESADFGMVWRGEVFGDADDAEGSAFVYLGCRAHV
jgi:hypothetical protein